MRWLRPAAVWSFGARIGKSRGAAAFLACGLACFPPDDGREPDLGRIYFPTGIAMAEGGERLLVANSDWDLQFNAGSVHLYDARAIRAQIPAACETDGDCSAPSQVCDNQATDARAPSHVCVDRDNPRPCGELGETTAAERLLSPAPCAAADNRQALLDTVGIGAFATDLLYRAAPGGGGRLFLPVRSDASLHWIDLAEGATELDCGAAGTRRCDSAHRTRSGREVYPVGADTLPLEPYGIAASEDGTRLVLSHQTESRLTLLANDWADPEGPQLLSVAPTLVPSRPLRITSIPVPALKQQYPQDPRGQAYQAGYLACLRNSQLVHLFRVFEPPPGPPTPIPSYLQSVGIVGAGSGGDLRDVTADASRRSACEQSCAPSSGEHRECLAQCARVPLDLYFASRSPDALLVGNTVTEESAGGLPRDIPSVTESIPVPRGPSRVNVGQIRAADGSLQTRVFVLSFDGRAITVYDPATRAVEATIATGRGPQAIAFDPEHALAYVAHFTDSYVGVVDLDRRHRSYASVVLNLGAPTRPRGDDEE